MDFLNPLAVRQAAQPGPPPAESLSANPVAAVLAITIIMFLIVAAKVYTKAFITKQPGMDDLMAMIGSFFVIADAAVIVSVFYDSGLSTGSASPAAIEDPKLAKRLFVYLLLGPVPNGFAKLSILFLLLKIFPRIARPITAYCIYLGITVVFLFYSINVLYTGIHCGPYRHSPCSVDTQVKIAKASASVNLTLDVYVMAIAIVNIWTLHMTTRHKLGVIVVFLTGILALVCSIITLYYRVVTTVNPNAIWTQVLVPLVLVIYEPAIAMITASLPATPSLWVRISKTQAFTATRNLLSRLTGRSNSFGSVELTDHPSQNNRSEPYGDARKSHSKRSQDVYTDDLEPVPLRANNTEF
ncbi:hypothetical protein OCU04_000179 [Sclerotinia nivalis]|uniref:Rhodopsin domain-containing protein n=1 Tax=Sclerotinia nivalis TaxID=352851 RepID=A0A9X0AW24_9HELO|nr:hypothetical protein OCU04_000179 [Sclerotinia nivalis]